MRMYVCIYSIHLVNVEISMFIFKKHLNINTTRRIIYNIGGDKMTKEYKQKLNLTVDKEIKEYLKIKAVKENTTVSAIITELVEKMMSSDKGGK